MTFFGSSEPEFDPADAFVSKHVPDPGAFLADHDVLTGDDHVALHRHAADAFEEHGVYDATFGYNLARLNRDPRHPDAGLRYAEERGDASTLRAEFTPTTAFCPQAEPLAVGALRALTAPDASHGYDRVRVRVDGSLDGSEAVNERLAAMEDALSDREAADGSAASDCIGAADDGPAVVLDVRDRDDPPFPAIADALDDLDDGETLRLVNDFEPAPLYDVLSDRGFDHETERVADDEWRVAIQRP